MLQIAPANMSVSAARNFGLPNVLSAPPTLTVIVWPSEWSRARSSQSRQETYNTIPDVARIPCAAGRRAATSAAVTCIATARQSYRRGREGCVRVGANTLHHGAEAV